MCECVCHVEHAQVRPGAALCPKASKRPDADSPEQTRNNVDPKSILIAMDFSLSNKMGNQWATLMHINERGGGRDFFMVS